MHEVLRRPLRVFTTLAIFVALSGCGKAPPEEPVLAVDREAMTFGREFDRAVYVGTSKQESLLLQNTGTSPLVVEEVVKVSDPEFTLLLPEGSGAGFTIEPGGHAFLAVYFEPTEAKAYSGLLTIRSNAANAPEQLVTLEGVGTLPP